MMDNLSVESVFETYERIRPRLVQARFPKAAQSARNLLDIAHEFDAIIFDSFGVLNVGNRATEGAIDCVAQLRALSKRVIVLTNAASYPLRDALTKYRRLGFDFRAHELVSSRAVTAEKLSGETGLLAAICDPEDHLDEFEGIAKPWHQEHALEAAGFLLLAGHALTPDTMSRLEATLRSNPRPVYVANPDQVAPRENGLSHEPGLAAHLLIDKLGIEAEFFGKPFANAFDTALALLPGIPHERIAMVGDTLHTDILGGAAAGLRTVLITDHGIMAGRDATPFITRSGIVPDFILPSI